MKRPTKEQFNIRIEKARKLRATTRLSYRQIAKAVDLNENTISTHTKDVKLRPSLKRGQVEHLRRLIKAYTKGSTALLKFIEKEIL